MNIIPVSLNLVSKTTAYPAFGIKSKTHKKENSSLKADVFTKRDDKYIKAYKSLIEKAYKAENGGGGKKVRLKPSDIKFLLDIKDYNKFRSIITAPVEIERTLRTDKLNIFFFTDAQATNQIAKRLNKNGDRKLLKELLMQQRGFDGQNVFHELAEEDEVKKLQVLKNNLSIKEFKRFMKSKDDFHRTPYSIAQERNNNVKALAEPLFMDEFPEY